MNWRNPGICYQQVEALGGSPVGTTLLQQIQRVTQGRNNIDMNMDEFLTHVRQDQQQYFLERLREYEAMLHLVGLLAGWAGTPDEQNAARDAVMAAINTYLKSVEERVIGEYPGVTQNNAVAVTLADWFGLHEMRDHMLEAGRIENYSRAMMGQMLVDFFSAIWQSLVDWWNKFWTTYEAEGLIIAMNRARIDLTFLAAECAIDVAITFALSGAGVAIAGALKGLRFVGKRVGRTVTRVAVHAIPDGLPNPQAVQLHSFDIPDSRIDPQIDRIIDEDRFGGASRLADADQRATPNQTTNTTTRVNGQSPTSERPPISGRTVSDAEWRRLRSGTPTLAIRDQVNAGQPVASRTAPVPDEWLPGLERTARLQADHIVPADRIRHMDGFADLTHDQQLAVLNYEPNFHGLSQSANSSRGAQFFMDWTMHRRTGTLVNNDLRVPMIETERALEVRIQEMIYELLRQNQSGTVVPFRTQ